MTVLARTPRTLQRLFSILVCIAFALGTTSKGHAQNDRATVTGTVKDQTGAIIPGARITLTDPSTGVSVKGTSNSDGIFTVPGLPVGTYVLKGSHPGFGDYVQTNLILVAAQVLKLDVRMALGSDTQVVTVTDSAPLLDKETATVAITMDAAALEDLPLDATGGQDAMNLVLAVTPGANGTNGTNQDFIGFNGAQQLTNSVYLNGVEATAGLQGNLATPGKDALQEIQVMTNSSSAEFGTSAVQLFQIKSGTNKIHGSAFEILRNEALNANSWSNNYYLAQCAPSNASCISNYRRAKNRFNDYGFSAGGPIRKNRMFIFGSYERYNATDLTKTPNSLTVPTAKMLTGDFSELLTGGAQTGAIAGTKNPCTGLPYQYGQIFNPKTQRTVSGTLCADPFPGNIINIPLSSVALKMANIYKQYYAPTSTRIYSNFPKMVNTPVQTKTAWDFKYDQTITDRQRLTISYDRTSWNGLGQNGNFLYMYGPFSSYWNNALPTTTVQAIHTYSLRPNLLNTTAVEFTQQNNTQVPQYLSPDNGDQGFNSDSTVYPKLAFSDSVNGVLETPVSVATDTYYGYYGYHFQDTVIWTTGKHSFTIGGTFVARGMNATSGGNVETFTFRSVTGGPTSTSITPYVGSSFAAAMLGNVQSASKAIPQRNYPRQKSIAFFAQDAFKVNRKLTLNLGLRWDFNFRGHEQSGRWQNFDLTKNNPNWGTYLGAWQFAQDSGQSFEKNQDYHEFAPRVGWAYEITPRLVSQGSYGLFYVPLSTFNSGYGSNYAANQNSLSFPTSQILNTVGGSTAFNWDNGYPAAPVLGPQDNTNTLMGSTGTPLYIHPDYLRPGNTQNWYLGFQYAVSKKTALYVGYLANRGRNLQGSGQSAMQNYPAFSVYAPLLASGKISNTVNSAATAAAAGVPYPYAGFSGPAYAAISPYPQTAANGVVLRTYGDPRYAGVSAYDSMLVEYKARAANGLYADVNYVLSKSTGNISSSNGNWAGSTSSFGQNLEDALDSKHWIQASDRRHVLRGYLTYRLPFGKDRKWLAHTPSVVNKFVEGWELGYFGIYESGVPMGQVKSKYQLPFFFGNDRAFITTNNVSSVKNQFKGKINLNNLLDTSNKDFDTSLFAVTTPTQPFGNTPYTWNHWRWNQTPAQENLSLVKRFSFGEHNRFNGMLTAQFFNVFNRHYFGAPDTNQADANFGQVTSISGNRTGQLTARFSF